MSAPHVIYWDEWLSGWEVGPDAATARLALTPSSTDIEDSLDAATEYLALTPSASDTAQYVDPTTPPDEAYLERTGSAGPFGETVVEKRAQSFTAPGSYIVSRAQLSLQKLGSPTDNLIVQICSDSGGSPSTVLATATIVGSSLSTSLNLITFFFNNDVTLTSGSTYWIVTSRDGSLDNTNRYAWERTTPGNYAGGIAKNFQSGSWASDSTRDHIFVVSFYPNPLPRISLTPSTTDTAQFVDAATESLLLTPSSTDILAHEYSDAATEVLKLSPYVTEEYPVVSLKLTPNSVEKTIYEDILLVVEELQPDIYPGGGNTQQNLGSQFRYAQSFLTPITGSMMSVGLWLFTHGSPTDNFVIELQTDNANKPSGTVLASRTISPSDLPAGQSNTITTLAFDDISVVSGDRYWICFYRTGSQDDTNYVQVRTYASFFGYADNYTRGAQSSSNNSGASWTTGGGINDYAFRAYFESVNVPRLNLNPSSSDTAQFVDQDTEPLSLVPSSVDTEQFVDSNTERVGLTPSSTDTAQFVDSATETLHLSPYVTEEYPWVPFHLTPSDTDIAQFVDSDTESFKFTPSGVDVYVPSGFTGVDYFDASTETLALTASATDIIAAQDAAIQRLSLSPSADDTAQFSDSALEILTLTPTFTETIQGSDTSVEALYLAPSSADIAQFIDELEVYLRLHPSAYELYKIYELLATVGEMRWGGIAYQHYFSKMDLLKYSASIMFKRWWGRID